MQSLNYNYDAQHTMYTDSVCKSVNSSKNNVVVLYH